MTLKGFAKFAAAALLTATLAVPAYADLKVSGDIDFGASITNNDEAGVKTDVYSSSVAGTIRLKDKKESGDNFVAAEIEAEFNNSGTVDMEEIYMQMGNKEMNLKVGNFEKLDTFAIGLDEVAATAPTVQDGAAYGRAGTGATDMAFQYTAVEGVTVEMGAMFGENSSAQNVTAFRPAVSAKVGDMLTVNAAYNMYSAEAQNSDNSDEVTKSGLSAQVVYSQDNIEAALSIATQSSEEKGSTGTTTAEDENMSYNLYATLGEMGPGSLGLSYSGWTDTDKSAATEVESKGSMWFATYLMPIMGVEGTTLGAGYSSSVVSTDGAKDTTVSTMGVTLDYRF